MDFSKHTDTLYASLKVSALLVAYCTVLTMIAWIGMYCVSFIPIPGLVSSQDALWDFQKTAIFWAGIMWGTLALFVITSKTDLEIKREDEGKVSIKL